MCKYNINANSIGEFGFALCDAARQLRERYGDGVKAVVYFGSAVAAIYPCIILFNIGDMEVRIQGAMDANGRIAALHGTLPDGEFKHLMGNSWVECAQNIVDFVQSALQYYGVRVSAPSQEGEQNEG